MEKVISLNEDKKNIEKKLKNFENQSLITEEVNEQIINIGNVKFISNILKNVLPNSLKGLADNYLSKENNCVVALISTDSKKISLVVGVSNNLSEKFNAVDLVKVGATTFGGKGGGGRSTMAQSGGNDINASSKTITALIDHIKKLN